MSSYDLAKVDFPVPGSPWIHIPLTLGWVYEFLHKLICPSALTKALY